MARPNRIWFRKDTGWWMVTIDGKKIRLAEGRLNRKQADQKFHELKIVQARPAQSSDARIVDIIDRFLSWCKIHRSSETCRNLIWYGQLFAERIGYLKATDLRPHHVTEWVDGRKWNPTTQKNARRSVYRAFSWAVEEGLLVSNPLKGMKYPTPLTRQRVMTENEFRSILKGSKREFKILVYVLRSTGCRPKEARCLKWGQVFPDRWILAEHKTAYKTHKPRVIYLIPSVRRLMDILRREGGDRCAPDQFVFRNARQRPWSVNAIRLRITRLKRKLHLADDLCCYHLRHAFGTSAVLNGVDVATVAQLMGHKSIEMISRVYLHLADQHQHLSQAAQQATGSLASSKRQQVDPD